MLKLCKLSFPLNYALIHLLAHLLEHPFVLVLLSLGRIEGIAQAKGMEGIVFTLLIATRFPLLSQLSQLLFKLKAISLSVSEAQDAKVFKLLLWGRVFNGFDCLLSFL